MGGGGVKKKNRVHSSAINDWNNKPDHTTVLQAFGKSFLQVLPENDLDI